MRNRLSAAVGECIDLNVRLYKNGEPLDPYALRVIRIYKCSVNQENLVLEITLPDPVSSDYDLSSELIYNGLIRRCGDTSQDGLCGTDNPSSFTPGCFIHRLNLCKEIFESGVYYDVWGFIGDSSDLVDDCGTCGEDVELGTDVNLDDEDNWSFICNRFYVSNSGWFGDDGLKNIRFGFEPLDSRFTQPEKRLLEVGLMPLPLYSYDSSKVDPIIPTLIPKITIETAYCELIIDSEPMKIGIRQGSFRSNPYVLQYLLDTSRFLKGTYRYRIDVDMPNGETRSSPYFNLAVR